MSKFIFTNLLTINPSEIRPLADEGGLWFPKEVNFMANIEANNPRAGSVEKIELEKEWQSGDGVGKVSGLPAGVVPLEELVKPEDLPVDSEGKE